MQLSLETATPSDLDAVKALVEAAYRPWVAEVGLEPGPLHDDYAARIAAGQVRLAQVDGRLAGLLVLIQAGDHLLLDNVAIAPGMQGRGLGRALVDKAEETAWRLGLPEVRLYTHARMTSNIALYERLGFHETHRVTEKGFDRVYMAKPV
ncbi:GNAT family N-acetyltransferase [Salipiger mucosus]|uniref:Acetyltransferase, GNAT family protein n=1 Tax=Salipiger mucosus DSM 16094 TaxID=1123237 RepID=S9RL48_9RHOB|nr:GNAT family N-acetyltransferase [Salipiger mucosus]EPX78865.1 acetyltransferase, GNAT family protein [Salipiger mucosus DSM 16094]